MAEYKLQKSKEQRM